MRIRRLAAALAFAAGFSALAAAPARAELLIRVDKSAQLMTVTVDGAQLYAWPVSTGAPGYDTPSGEFKPFRMEAEHYSQEWDDAPMPHSIFFTQQGHAIHGSGHVKNLGRPASHGCVRLEPKNAAILFALVKHEKMANTRVVLAGETPGSAGVPMARRDTDAIYSEEDTGALPARRTRASRDYYRDEPRSYYYSDRYAPPRRYNGSFPFGW
ncbi:MAG TPA: L,D-transpeptidase [Pseudolabrys sp.]|nr:L,D-transpeptidase [Pseudolabrys sp.]